MYLRYMKFEIYENWDNGYKGGICAIQNQIAFAEAEGEQTLHGLPPLRHRAAEARPHLYSAPVSTVFRCWHVVERLKNVSMHKSVSISC